MRAGLLVIALIVVVAITMREPFVGALTILVTYILNPIVLEETYGYFYYWHMPQILYIATFVSMALRLPVYDTQCGAKLFRVSPEIRSLFETPFRSNWVFDVELLARLIRSRKESGGSPVAEAIYENPLQEWRDVAGSKVKAHDCIIALYELGVIYWTYLWGLKGIGAKSASLRENRGGSPHDATQAH